MIHPTLAKFQIGKNGLTEGVLDSLGLALKHHRQVRVSVLKSACRDREELKKIALQLTEKLPVKNHKIIGYTIILIK
ncbi:MAG: YhbY family RNA-binding protein [Nanoarchaeota archaeon]|nr:YhbY family RNA-binding protein [Nanoarchaeota archaeon]MBU0977327.1 YhbY family RNA-binding protein [Nanoarchaeota archaeon]